MSGLTIRYTDRTVASGDSMRLNRGRRIITLPGYSGRDLLIDPSTPLRLYTRRYQKVNDGQLKHRPALSRTCRKGIGSMYRDGNLLGDCKSLDDEQMTEMETLEAMAALLQASAYSGDANNIREILESGTVSPDAADSELTTPLMLASAAGHLECVKILVEFGAYINAKRSTGSSALFLSAQSGHVDVVRFLSEVGALIDSQCMNGATALFIASQNGYLNIVQYLTSKGSSSRLGLRDKTSPIFVAAQNGHDAVIRHLASCGANVNVPRQDGTSPLWMACQMGHLRAVSALLELGADADSPRSVDGVTPTFKAASKGFKNITELLLKKKPNLGLQKSGYSPLHAAAYFGHLGIVQMLLENGANPNLYDKDGLTAAQLSASRGFDSISRIINLQQRAIY